MQRPAKPFRPVRLRLAPPVDEVQKSPAKTKQNKKTTTTNQNKLVHIDVLRTCCAARTIWRTMHVCSLSHNVHVTTHHRHECAPPWLHASLSRVAPQNAAVD